MSNKSSTSGKEIKMVSKDKLENILSTVENQTKQIEILQNTVSNQRLKEAEENHGKKFLLQGHLKRLRGKVIIGWYPMEKKGRGLGITIYNLKNDPFEIREEDSKAKMEMIYRDNVPVGERLVGHYKTIEGKDIVCDAVEFYRSDVMEKFDRLKDEGLFWIIRFHNPLLPQKFRLNIKFINP